MFPFDDVIMNGHWFRPGIRMLRVQLFIIWNWESTDKIQTPAAESYGNFTNHWITTIELEAINMRYSAPLRINIYIWSLAQCETYISIFRPSPHNPPPPHTHTHTQHTQHTHIYMHLTTSHPSPYFHDIFNIRNLRSKQSILFDLASSHCVSYVLFNTFFYVCIF